jgi:bifunctional UDP-N-acetylglucosamine pyrophosphorylase/glucosamine-1-phosphate N-acetyltransferase
MAVSVIILAAGKGTRMRSKLPKVLHAVCGKPMLHHVMDTARRFGAEHQAVVIGPDMDEVRAAAEENDPAVRVFIQEQQLGTGDAVKAAKDVFNNAAEGDVTFILYADTPFVSSASLEQMQRASETSAVVVLGFEPEDPSEYGRLKLGEEGALEAIIEYKEASEDERKIGLCNSGVMAVHTQKLADLLSRVADDNAKGEYYLTDIVEIANADGLRCATVRGDENEVLGVNNREQLAEAEAIMQDKLRKQAMENGVTLIAPETVFLQEDTVLGKDVVIHPNVVFAAGVKLHDGVEIRSFCHLEGVEIKKNAVVGPFARLRPGTVLEEEVRIGNFVEVKKTHVAKGAKINHLTYVGDAEVGEGANIGAGTVTCNYDGYNKHQTKIGKNSFIGSNSSLVAPVEIGEGAIVAAGATVTKDVPKDALVKNDMPQTVQEGRAKEMREAQK